MQQTLPPCVPPQTHPIRQFFAGTIAAILQGLSGGLATSVVAGLTGSITNWFNRKQQQQAAMSYSAYGASGTAAYAPGYAPGYAPSPSPYSNTTPSGPIACAPSAGASSQTPATAPQGATYPGTSVAGQPASTQPGMPSPLASGPLPAQPVPGATTADQTSQSPQMQPSAYSSATPTANTPGAPVSPSAGTSVIDSHTGQGAGDATAALLTSPDGSGLYAGIAYEVHTIGPGGAETQVDTTTHQFRTGDQFKVYFRPSTPGHMEVYNINAAGQQTQIDAADLAAGQLTVLGPYAFAGASGDESLRLMQSTCANPQLLASTRDIVNAAATPPTSGVRLPACGAASRGVTLTTRDIQKVTVDGSTSFALDAISKSELSSSQIAPRVVTITFHHL